MKQDLLQKQQASEIVQHIGYEAGEEMVKKFYDKHTEMAYGNIVGCKILEKILAQPDYEGIIILPGDNTEGIRQSVLVGITGDGSPTLKYNVINAAGQIESEEGIVADRLDLGWFGEE